MNLPQFNGYFKSETMVSQRGVLMIKESKGSVSIDLAKNRVRLDFFVNKSKGSVSIETLE